MGFVIGADECSVLVQKLRVATLPRINLCSQRLCKARLSDGEPACVRMVDPRIDYFGRMACVTQSECQWEKGNVGQERLPVMCRGGEACSCLLNRLL